MGSEDDRRRRKPAESKVSRDAHNRLLVGAPLLSQVVTSDIPKTDSAKKKKRSSRDPSRRQPEVPRNLLARSSRGSCQRNGTDASQNDSDGKRRGSRRSRGRFRNREAVLSPKKKRASIVLDKPQNGATYGGFNLESKPVTRRPSMATPMSTGVNAADINALDQHEHIDWKRLMPSFLRDLDFVARLPTHRVLDYDKLGPTLPAQSLLKRHKPTLFLDLDETLIHCRLAGDGVDDHITTKPSLVFLSETDDSIADVFYRPYVREFIAVMAHFYELVIYTAALPPYANMILEDLDKQGHIDYRLYREHCTQYASEEVFFKDIHSTGRDIRRAIVLDNRFISFGLNPANGVLIANFIGQTGDEELLNLIPKFIKLSLSDDIRTSLAEDQRLTDVISRYQKDANLEVTYPTIRPFKQDELEAVYGTDSTRAW